MIDFFHKSMTATNFREEKKSALEGFLRSVNTVILNTLRFRAEILLKLNDSTHFYGIREENGSGRPPPPPTVHLRTDDVT